MDKLGFIVLAGVLSTLLATTSFAFSGLALLAGFGCTTLGAFVAAVRASQEPLLHGLLVALVGFLISFGRFGVFSLDPPADPGAIHSLSWELLGWALVFLAGFVGGSLGSRQLARRQTGRFS